MSFLSNIPSFFGYRELSTSSSESDVFLTPRESNSDIDDAASYASDDESVAISKVLLPRKSPQSESPRFDRSRIERKPDEVVEKVTDKLAKLTLEEQKPPSASSAPSILSTSEGKRRAFSQGKKTPPLDFGSVLVKPNYEKLTPRERSEFKSALQAKEDDSDADELSDKSPTDTSSPHTPRSGNLSKQSITRILATAEELDEKRRDTQLLNALEKFGNNTLRSNITFSTEAIMSPEHLFKIILDRINLRIKENTNESPKFIAQLLVFCIGWLGLNEGTKLVPKAAESLKSIIEATKATKLKFVQAQSTALERHLTVALEKKPAKAITVPALSVGSSTFEAYLDTVARGEAKDYKKRAKELSVDLFHMQIELFFKISQNDLVQKWKTPTQLGEPINRFSNMNNTLLECIIGKIVFQQELFGRRNLMRFFLEAGYQSLLLEDHQTSSVIFTILNNAVFEKLPKTCKKVHKHKHFKELKELFNGDRQFEALKKRVAQLEKDQSPYIPHLSLKVNECIIKEANHPGVVEDEDADSHYNLEKLAALRDQASQFPELQDRFRELLKSPPKPHTDFVEKHIKDILPFSTKESDANTTLRKLQADGYKELEKK